MTELKPCPFCGGKAEVSGSCGYSILCSTCEASVGQPFNFCEYDGVFDTFEEAAEAWNTRYVDGDTSDGYHTFNELYHHRAVLFSKIVEFAKESTWKSRLHAEGTMFDGYFIVGVETPDGQATYHYEIDPYWEMFDCKEVERAPIWDGHTPQEAIARIERWDTRAERTCRQVITECNDGLMPPFTANCSECGISWGYTPSYCPECHAKVIGD